MTLTLRQYQHDQQRSISDAFEQGLNRVLLKSPTGTGKTVMFAALPTSLAPFLAQHPKGPRMMVIAHREELLDQAAAKIQAANPGMMVSIEQGERRAHRYSDVIVASIQTLAARNFARLKQILTYGQPRIVICDEAHHGAAKTYRTAFVHLGFLPNDAAIVQADGPGEQGNIDAASYDDVEKMTAALKGWDAVAPKDRILVGVTATPNRSDAIGLGCVFQSIVYSYDLKQAIDDGWLVGITPYAVETKESLEEVHTVRGDFNQKELANAVNTPQRNRLAVKAWHEYASGLPTLGFTVDVAHAHDLAEEFVRAGVRARALSGETPKDERRAMLAAYSSRDLDLITNCMVLTEGTDLPLTECILHAKPTRSATLYEQITGRGLRPHPGKGNCIVIDMVDVSRRHSLQTAGVLYGLPPGLSAKGRDLRKLAEELEEIQTTYPNFDISQAFDGGGMLSLDQIKVKAQTFDIWTVPQLGAFGSGRAMNWIKIAEDVYRLQYPWQDGTEVLQVSKDLLGKWDLSLTLRPANGAPTRQRTIATAVVDADAAAGLAEAFVLQERRSIMKLKDKDAPWRSRPASPKQEQLLTRLRVPFKRPISMGQASDMIDLAQARRGRH